VKQGPVVDSVSLGCDLVKGDSRPNVAYTCIGDGMKAIESGQKDPTVKVLSGVGKGAIVLPAGGTMGLGFFVDDDTRCWLTLGGSGIRRASPSNRAGRGKIGDQE